MWQEINPQEDQELVRLSRSGDEDAFEKLVRKYQQNLFHLVYRHTGRPADVEDIVQKIVVKMYLSLDSYDSSRAFHPWLYRIAVNQCYDELRRRKRRRTFTFTDLELEETAAVDLLINRTRAPEPAEEYSEELHSLLYRTLDRLPEKHRRVIVLRDLEQVSYEEISSILRCTQQAARLKVLRARQRLRDLMSKTLRRRKLREGFERTFARQAGEARLAGIAS